MKHGLVLPNWVAGADVGRLVDAAVAAEESGWSGVFLADHLIFPPPPELGAASTVAEHWDMPDPWISLAAIASRTSTITLGTWVTPVARRLPWQTARDVATLDRLSGGRVLLGVGLGRRPDYELFGYPWSMQWAAERTDEALDIITRLWSGESVTHEGPHFALEQVTLLPTPHQSPRVPIVIGGLWPRKPAVRRGGRWDGIMVHFPGDGVLPTDGTPPREHAEAMIRYYRSVNTQGSGEIFLPMRPEAAHDDWIAHCHDLGATWLYTAKLDGDWSLNPDTIAEGPTSQYPT